MNGIITTISFLIIVNSAIFGQNQRYLSDDYFDIESIGFAYSEYDTISNGLYSGFYDIYKQAIISALTKDIPEIKFLNELLRFESIDTNKIVTLCDYNNLDAFLITKTYFLSRDFIYKEFLQLDKIYNPKLFQQGPYCCYVEIKIINKKGKLILNSTAITLNGYNASKSLKNGFQKAIDNVK
jgi:hypothetical protein